MRASRPILVLLAALAFFALGLALSTRLVAREVLARAAVLMSRPPDETQGPDPTAAGLAFETRRIDLGCLDPGATARVEFRWARRGAGPLRVLAVKSGCGCARAEGLPDLVEEGCRGVLAVDVAGRRRPGPFSADLRVLTDRPPHDVHCLRVEGFVGREVFVDPTRIDVGPVPAGRALAAAVAIRPPPGSEAAPVFAALRGLEGVCDVGAPAHRGAVGSDVRVRALAPRQPGDFEAEIEVRVGEATVRRIPIVGRVVAE